MIRWRGPAAIGVMLLAVGLAIGVVVGRAATGRTAPVVASQPVEGTPAAARVFYVSPDGDDENPGTEEEPWETVYHAAQTLRPGQTAIFEDGTYDEDRQTKFQHDGTAEAPIVLMARNKHQAVIEYDELEDEAKLLVNRRHVTIKDFEITQDDRGDGNFDKLVECGEGSDGCRIVGNYIHHAAEECIKLGHTSNLLVEGNICTDTQEDGIDAVDIESAIIRDNEVTGGDGVGIMLKGGTRDVEVYGNEVRSGLGTMQVGIALGGNTDSESVDDPSGYEAYDLVAWENTVIATESGQILTGLQIRGCDGCSFLNNMVVGARYGLATAEGGGEDSGWTWDVLARDPTFKDNVVVCPTEEPTQFGEVQGTLVDDGNRVQADGADCPTDEDDEDNEDDDD